MTEDQRNLFSEIVGILDAFQRQDAAIIEKGRWLASSFTQKEIGELMQKASEPSSNAQQSPVVETERIILSLIVSQPGLTATQIRDNLEQFYDKSISTKRVQQILNDLKARGKVATGNEKMNLTWSIKLD